MASRYLTITQRNNFKRIMAQLERTRTDKGILRIIAQAQKLMDEVHVGWDAIQLYLPQGYVFKNTKNKWKPIVLDANAIAKVATAVHPASNGAYPLGRDGRALLKIAVAKHPDWPVVRETLGVDMSHTNIADLVAIAQLLKLDERFIAMFTTVEDPTPEPAAEPDHPTE
jgi:hypothetical protein